jgi:hypothetical protein
MTKENTYRAGQRRRDYRGTGRRGGTPLPDVPKTGSPVPGLTSLHGRPGRGPYGDPRYRGNCSGLLIEDLLRFYGPRRVLDPMEGGGTCRDVCRALGIAYEGRDLKTGFDATCLGNYERLGRFDFIWLHPPYWRMIPYNDGDARCRSGAASVAAFLEQLGLVLRNCAAVLAPGGKLALLMGDGKHGGRYLGLPFRAMNAAAAEGYWLAAPEIIRFGHGSTSARRSYSGSFIPRVHDVCLVLVRDA